MPLPQQDRIDAGVGFDWDALPPLRNSLTDLPHDAQELRFRCKRASHRGIHRFRSLRRLWLYGVNQQFLEELAEVPSVEMLYVKGLTATDLTPLHKLGLLRRLVLIGGTKIQGLDWVLGLPSVEALAIENFKRVGHLDPLMSLANLTALGVEGSIWTTMRAASLAPLSRLDGLRYLFLTALRVADQSLQPLHRLTGLQVLRCSAYFPDEEFVRLGQALPALRCGWIDMIARHGSTREGLRAAMASIQVEVHRST